MDRIAYEPSELRAKGPLAFALALSVLLAGSSLIIYRLQHGLAAAWIQAQPAAAWPPQPGPLSPGLVHEPALQGTPSYRRFGPEEVAALRRDEDRVLDSYGFVDRQHTVVHIPIRQAMKLLVERGPSFAEGNP